MEYEPRASALEVNGLPDFEHPLVQWVYELLCSQEMPPNPQEHWEGWYARKIVAFVSAAEREACVKFVETEAADYLARADRLHEAGALGVTVVLHEQAGAALEATAMNMRRIALQASAACGSSKPLPQVKT